MPCRSPATHSGSRGLPKFLGRGVAFAMFNATPYESGAYLASNPDWHSGDTPWKARHVRELAMANGLSPASVVDVGCGTGGVLLALRDCWPSATMAGYDISTAALGLMAPPSSASIAMHTGTVQDIDRQFELALCLDVFEHVPDYLGFLDSLRSRATFFIFHIPLDLSAQSVMRSSPLTHARETVGHLHYFTRDTAMATLSDSGYRIIDWRLLNASRASAAPRLPTRLARVPRRLGERVSPEFFARLLGGFTLLVLARPALDRSPWRSRKVEAP